MMEGNLKISDEELLLLHLCRLDFDEASKKSVGTIMGRITGWDRFSKLANSHGVASLAYHNIASLGLESHISGPALSFLKNARFKSMARNTALMRQMDEVLRVTDRSRIKIVLLKGLALELIVYGNSGLRQMSDIDILAEKGDALKAQKELIRSGFKPLPPKSLLHKPITGSIGKHLPSLVKNGLSIEIHHELFSRENSMLTEKLYDAAMETDMQGRKIIVPSPGLFFLYLVKHLYMHEVNNESQLRLYTDLYVMAEKYGNKVLSPELLENAARAGMSEMLASRLKVLGDFWGISFPAFISEFIDKWHDPAFAGRFVFFLGSPKGNPAPDRSRSYREKFRDISGIHRKALYFIGDLFPTISFMKKRYGCRSAWKAALYYPHRLGKIAWLFRK